MVVSCQFFSVPVRSPAVGPTLVPHNTALFPTVRIMWLHRGSQWQFRGNCVILSVSNLWCRCWRFFRHLRISRSSVQAYVAVEAGMDLGVEGFSHSNAEQLVAEVGDYVKTGICKTREWRMQQLGGILKLVEDKEGEIAEALQKDLGKSAYETFVSEISLLQGSCKLAMKELSKWMSPQKVAGTLATFPSVCTVVQEPLGVALIISAWNFPLLLALDPLVGAVSAGNAVVLKPSEVAPATSKFLATFVPQYLDKNAVKVVEGGVPETTALLDQKWDKIFYTGSPRVGRIVMAKAARHLTPVTLELGGKCPTIVDSTVDLKVTARRIAVGKWGNNNGQACIAPDFILAEEAVVPELVDALRSTLKEFYGDDPKLSPDIAKIVNTNHLGRLRKLVGNESADKVTHGGDWDEKRLYHAPTLVVNPAIDSPLMTEEIFGPILPIVAVKSVEEAVDFVNSRPKPLALYLFTNNKKVEQQVVADTSAGGMVVNDTILHFVVPGLPFGGVGESGIGAYRGKFSFEAFSHKKAVLTRGLQVDLSARYPPFTKYKQNIVRSLLSGDFLGLLWTILGLKK